MLNENIFNDSSLEELSQQETQTLGSGWIAYVVGYIMGGVGQTQQNMQNDDREAGYPLAGKF